METKFYHEDVINASFQNLYKYKDKAMISFMTVIQYMKDIKELSGEFEFYKNIADDIMENRDGDLSIDEKDHFLNIHSRALKFINENY